MIFSIDSKDTLYKGLCNGFNCITLDVILGLGIKALLGISNNFLLFVNQFVKIDNLHVQCNKS